MEFLKLIREDFEKMKNDERHGQEQKNIKYASLMTAMESFYKIPILAGKEFDELDPAVKALYLEISDARVF